MRKHSLYDGIILLDGNINHIKNKITLIKKNPNSNFLGITFNHRKFSLKEINNIRTEIENLDIDNLMFSIRPSFKIPNIKKYKNFLQIIYTLKICEIYRINTIYLSKAYKKFIPTDDINTNVFFKKFKLFKKNCLIKNKKNKKALTFFNSFTFKKKLNLKKLKYFYFENDLSGNKVFSYYRDINKNLSKIFWLGFDRNYQEVPWEKKYKKDSWSKYASGQKSGTQLFKKINYCSRCCTPETWEGIKFDNQNICSICKSAEDKMTIEWKNKEHELNKIFKKYKNDNYYECLLPISGGKDSTFQSFVLTKKYKLNPLAITHGQNWFSMTGRKNLENCLQKFDLDHLFFCASRKKINYVAKKSLEKIGDACWHCHIGVGAFSWQTSLDWNIKLVVYGEAPADTDARGSFKKKQKFTPYGNIKNSAIVTSDKFISKNYNFKKLSNWSYPEKKILNKFNPQILYLGQYMFWDEQKNIDYVSKHFGWLNSKVENTYKGYKSNECIMAGVHDYINFLKRGIGRATVHASDDVRRGLITREQGFDLIKNNDIKKPHALEYYKKITGLTDSQINKKIVSARKKSKYASKFKI